MDHLFTLAEGIRKCTACPLWKSRLLAVPGDGSLQPSAFFVGEAPGQEEDRTGQPFVGRSGKFLDVMLGIASLQRKDVFITGAVKCHPPKNRMPLTKELRTCRDLWLQKQLALAKPKVVVLLGNAAVCSLLGRGNVGDLHGKIIKKDYTYFVTYHPAAGMRFPKIRKRMEEDFKRLTKFI